MIRFDQGDRRFNYRIAGVAIHEDKVLLHRVEGEGFWTLPGGRVELGESSEQTIRREMREELGTEIDVLRPLWFVENFFDYDGLAYHEISLYFLIQFPSGSRVLSEETFESADAGVRLMFRWFPVQADLLKALPLLPSFLSSGLSASLSRLPASVTHLVHHGA